MSVFQTLDGVRGKAPTCISIVRNEMDGYDLIIIFDSQGFAMHHPVLSQVGLSDLLSEPCTRKRGKAPICISIVRNEMEGYDLVIIFDSQGFAMHHPVLSPVGLSDLLSMNLAPARGARPRYVLA